MENTVTGTVQIMNEKPVNYPAGNYSTRQSVIFCIISYICNNVIPIIILNALNLLSYSSFTEITSVVLRIVGLYICDVLEIIAWIPLYKVRNHNSGNGFGKAMKKIIKWRWIAVGVKHTVMNVITIIFTLLFLKTEMGI